MRILHLTYDYPDKIKSNKTVAIKNLINASDKVHKNMCISLNRVNRRNDEKVYYDNNIISISNFGLPKGLFFRQTLKRSYNIVNSLNINFDELDLIHAHKLTFEGYIAYELYKSKNIPYIITLRHTDQVVLRVRRDLINYYKKVLLNAKQIIVISPWMKEVFKEILGESFYNKIKYKIYNIANIMNVKNKVYLEQDNGRFVSIFHLKNEEIRRKNIKNVLRSIKLLKKSGIEIKLDIIGDGVARNRLEKEILKNGLENNVKCLGARKNSEIISIVSQYRGLILCSYPETFGMVFIEAICAGIPIISARNTGIDGFFQDEIGEFINHTSVEEIANAIKSISENTNYYKSIIKKIQDSSLLEELFSEEAVVKKYCEILDNIKFEKNK